MEKRRAPHGARGLKRKHTEICCPAIMSRPAWGAWIETGDMGAPVSGLMSRPAWGAWIET